MQDAKPNHHTPSSGGAAELGVYFRVPYGDGKAYFSPPYRQEYGLAQGQHCQKATYSRVRARPLTTRSICATVAPCAGSLHGHVSGGPQPADLHSGGSIQRVTY